MSQPVYISEKADHVLLAVKIQPRASKNEIGGVAGNELKIKVTAPPVDSAANEAVLRLLADSLNCSRNQIEIVRGQTSRHKTMKIRGLSVTEVVEKLHGSSGSE